MLGYVVAEGRGEADRCLREVVAVLRDAGLKVAGAVQSNVETGADQKCQMDLHILNGGPVIKISQDLGALSQGCRLDPDGLERAVGLVAASLEQEPQVLILNKFGKQELEGRGFRPVVGEALMAGIPVLTAVNERNLERFQDFAGDICERLPADVQALKDWVLAQRAELDA
ncbi:DUF2478 domain-containing protein [Thalassovita mangrovi]|uniref:DUF2478 domain-containing protein n=1 Tax=Thalassovita mangrovi TaxID=2692236 RepID=A0A6L8LJH2_9RHOB|nr:DUF2478 domain-containing protein [Thalassovita mangrovi]MYM55985.1 DUF2478 domain-containing protein [Thalassovita mangrovi]